jgi:hypothetical protein
MRGLGEMTIDISKIKPGDKVTLVPLEVFGTDRDVVCVMLNSYDHLVGADQIAAHHPAPSGIGVGDRVVFGAERGIVEHVSRNLAWVIWDNGGDGIWPLSVLTLEECDCERA